MTYGKRDSTDAGYNLGIGVMKIGQGEMGWKEVGFWCAVANNGKVKMGDFA